MNYCEFVATFPDDTDNPNKIKPANPADYDGLLTAEQYAGEVA